MSLLDVQQNLLVQTFNESFLLITAEGLGLERLFVKHLELYADPSILVIVLNTNHSDHEYFLRHLRHDKGHDSGDSTVRHAAPKILTASVSADERKAVYLQGGVVFATTRILVTDILKEIIPFHLVSGVLFYRAHAVLRSSLESFVIRCFRERKSDGFVKAFSENAAAFSYGGLGALQRAVSALRVEKVRFLPRFHSDVIAELEKCKPDLIEVPVQMKPAVQTMQCCILELILACLQELKHCFAGFINEDVSIENALSEGFEKAVQRRLNENDTTADELTPKARQLLTDVSRLRQLLYSLENDDAKTFAALLANVRGGERDFRNNSGWLFTPSAQKVYDIGMNKRHRDETPAKWTALQNVIDELKIQNMHNFRVLVAADDERICAQLAENILLDASDDQFFASIRVGWRENDWNTPENKNQNYLLLLPLNERYHLLSALDIALPTVVILYNVDRWIVRQLEIYNSVSTRDYMKMDAAVAEEGVQRLKVYFLMYENSSEEQRYLSSLKKERDAFDQLFKEDAALLIRKIDDIEAFQHSTTIEGQHTIVVDLREFRSELPTLLHTRGIRIAPVTLTVADYILTPQICIERKAVADLIGSLQSGRLYDQCKAMCEHYERPVVLVELNGAKKSWRRVGDQIIGRLVGLTLNFHQIRFVWAASPAAAADLLLDIKWKRDKPNVEEAVEKGKEMQLEAAEKRADVKTWAEQILLCLPDANATNFRLLTRAAPDFRTLCKRSEKQLTDSLSSQPWAKRVHEFLNRDFREKPTNADQGKKVKKRK